MSMLSSLKLGNPGLVLATVAIAAKCSFGILGQLVSPPKGRAGTNAIFAGDLSQGFFGLKLGTTDILNSRSYLCCILLIATIPIII